MSRASILERDEIPEKNYTVVLVKEEGDRESKAKVIDGEIIDQFVHEETPSERMAKFILYSKIAAGVSLISLIIALVLIGLSSTAEVISDKYYQTRNILALFLFALGLFTFILALRLDRKTKAKPKSKNSRRKKSKKRS